MNLSELAGEEKLLLARLDDLADQSENRQMTRFSFFLNERQSLIAREFIRQRRLDNTMLYGGYQEAVRVVAGFFPFYAEPGGQEFPIRAVRISFRKEDALTHRDILGAVMGLRIKRESVGDILVSQGCATLFAMEPVVNTILQDLAKVGRAGVRCEISRETAFAPQQEFEERKGTVRSLRLDCMVAMLTGLSREKASALLESERVQRDHVTVTNGAKLAGPGECITIRGFGKYLIDEVGSPTRKGRLPVTARKYV